MTLNDLTAQMGTEVAVSEWFEVTQHVIDEFADAIGDPQWIHVNPERAVRDSPFRDAAGRRCTVAHGFLTLSLLSHLLENAIDVTDRRAGINVGFNRVRFTAPVPVGSRVRGRFALANSEPIDAGRALTWNVTIECEGSDKPVVVAEWLTRVLTG